MELLRTMSEEYDVIADVKKAKNGDEKAKERIFINNAPLIKSVIKRFMNKGVEYDDLYQIGCMGFLKAINNFDDSFNVKFSTYTVPMIIGEIKRYMRDNGAIKVSRNLKILANKINRYIDEYSLKNNVSPTVDIIAEKFDITPEEAVVAMDSSRMPLSIFGKAGDDEDGQEMIEKISCSDGEDSILDRIQISKVIEGLTEREQKLIVLRYYRDKTQNEIAEALGVSQVQVSRLENKILDKIRLKF